ncbi:nucleotide sugar dehydrogenase [Micrococcus luteus]|nr:nucleotide sugar dehydrogenase [Micrococcus luteus]MCV7556926.1 nucleotide sugar dehydrogenase [Micrococcus luteus]
MCSAREIGGHVVKLVVIGQGYVGLPVSMRGVQVGHDVVGLDLSVERVTDLRAGRSYVEDISDSVIQAALETGRFRPSRDYADAQGFDVAVITVPTPLRDSLPDLTFIESAGASLAGHIRPGATVILESTTYPGTTDELLVPILEAGSGLTAGVDFHVGYSPERIDPGRTDWTFQTTPKVVSGLTPASLEKIHAFYETIIDTPVPVKGTREAELTKLMENTFRHVNIALVNELAVFAHQLGVDVWDAIRAADTKPFGFMKFTPGPGVGGHCLPVDPSYLSWAVKKDLGQTFRFVELANDVNDHQPTYVVERVMRLLNKDRKALNGAKVALLGLAYKRDSSDLRESPSEAVIRLLSEYGAEITAWDSWVLDRSWPEGVARAHNVADLRGQDILVVLTDHSDVDYSAVAALGVPVFDTRNVVPARANVTAL